VGTAHRRPYHLLYDEGPPVEAETWYLVLDQFNPIFAYTTNLANQVVGVDLSLPVPVRTPVDGGHGMTPAERYPGDAPFYLQGGSASSSLLFWLAVPVAIGYYRFERTDL